MQGIALLLAAAAAAADVVVNATSGAASLSALRAAARPPWTGKSCWTSPTHWRSAGFPPTPQRLQRRLIAEQIARGAPGPRWSSPQHRQRRGDGVPAPGATMFVSGDDPAAKAVVVDLLRDLGWASIVDLGSLSGARGQEMYLALWVRTMAALGTLAFTMAIAMPDGTAAVTPAGPASDPTTRD